MPLVTLSVREILQAKVSSASLPGKFKTGKDIYPKG